MKRNLMLGLVGLCLAGSVALAQESAADGQRAGRAGRGRGMIPDVTQAVNLTDQQKEKVAELTDKLRQDIREQTGQRDPDAMQKMREMRQEMLTAAKAGNDEKVKTLRKELNETGTMAKRRQLLEAYYADVEKVLTPEQKKPFAEWRKLQESDIPQSLLNDPKALQEALKKVDSLSDAQKNKVEAAFTRYEKAMADAKEDAQAQKAALLELGSQVVAVLSPSQTVLLVDAAGLWQRGQRGQGGGQRAGQ